MSSTDWQEFDKEFEPAYTKTQRQHNQLTVCGFIRQHYNFHLVPRDIQQLCVMMYCEVRSFDEWNRFLSHPALQFEDENPYTFQVADDTDEPSSVYTEYNQYQRRNAFGRIEVKAGEFQQWSLQILTEIAANSNKRHEVAFAIGVINKDRVSRDMTKWHAARQRNESAPFWTEPFDGYAYDASSGNAVGPKPRDSFDFLNVDDVWRLYGDHWGFGDTVSMTLDLTTNHCEEGKQFGLLSFAVNGKEQGIAFEEIPIVGGETYVMAVSFAYHINHPIKIELVAE